MWNYSEKVKDHFFNPRNARVVAEANAVGDVGSISCGDALRLMLRVDPQSETILEAGFQTFGCGSDDDHEDGKFICKCFGVDEGQIRRAVLTNGLTTLEEVINYTKAGGGCTSCHESIELALADILAEQQAAPVVAMEATKDPHWQEVVEAITELRPHIQADGGDMSLINVANHKVTVSLSGSCSGCMMTDMTLAWLQQKLMERTGCFMEVVAA
jgi:Fe-S cluster biogenesis protein NfuA